MNVGIDIGGTKLLGVALANGSTNVAATDKVPVPQDADALVSAIVAHAHALADKAGGNLGSIGVGCAGLISPDGVIHLSAHLPWMNGFALGDAVRAAAGVPAVVDNDANAAAWGERCIGAGRNADEMVMVTLGTGIGGGIIMGGHLLVGTHGFAGEVGHMVVDRHGPVHVTGMRGPWELYGSGTGLGKLMRDAAQKGELAAAVAAAGGIDELRGEHLETLLVAHDAEALAVLDHFGADVALGIANVVTILDPEVVVIGGGVVALGAPLFAAIDRHLDEVLFARRDRPLLRVVPAELGEQAGAIGAALRGRELIA